MTPDVNDLETPIVSELAALCGAPGNAHVIVCTTISGKSRTPDLIALSPLTTWKYCGR
jgi:hypothetical protein